MEPSEAGAGHRQVRLEALRYAAHGTLLLELKALGPPALPDAAPGAHIDLWLADDMVRQYSLITPLCTPSTYAIAVRRDPQGRGGSRLIHDELRPGAILRMGGPRNHFPLVEDAPHSLLIAGGIGITPLYAMFVRLRERGRVVALHYWCRSPDEALFRADIACVPGGHLHCRSGDAPDHRTLASVLAGVGDEVEIYCCGPQRMLDEFEALTQGRPPGRNHVERFTPAPRTPPAGAFTVVLGRSQRQIAVRNGESVLAALLRENIDVSYSCEEGVCGACETKVLAGTPVHRDSVYTPQEHERRSTMMICCSGSKTPSLTLDL